MKQIPVTEDLKQRLRTSFGPDATIETLVVFEATAANLLPLRKSSGIYKGARFAESMLYEMAAAVKTESVPLHIMHNTYEEAVGRVFDGVVAGEELRVQFALNGDTQAPRVADLNAGISDQVSVGVLPKRLLCSECGWDFMGEAATSENWWNLQCGNGHEIGQNGVHVRLAGLDSWHETSVVGKGAVNGSRIVGPSQTAFAASLGQHRLAASEKVPGSRLVCLAVVENTPNPKEPEMTDKTNTIAFDVNKMVADLSAAQTEAATKGAKVVELEASVADLTAKLAVASSIKPEDFSAALAALTDIAKRSMIALGEQDPTPPTDVTALVALISDKQAKLTAMIPATPRSESVDAKKVELTTATAGFRTAR